MGETNISIAERTKEHWKDEANSEEDSHMVKHWGSKHKEEDGPPRFRFEIVRYCRTALERQVGEATRIALRKKCLNSKAGYNRSGLTRLTLKPDEAPQPKRWQNSDHLDRAGLEAMSRRAEEKAKE